MHIPKTLVALSSLAGIAVAQTALKIMPFGDSITEITCWRALLWQQLQAGGVSNIDFVGSMTSGATCAGVSNYDRNHEGHSGYLAIDIANKNQLPGWLNNAKPDIVMMHLGTNDITSKKSNQDIINAFTTMLKQMRANKSTIKLIVAQIIPIPYTDATVVDLNNRIASWAASMNTTASPIYLADLHQGMTSSDMADAVHPNASGDKKIAANWYPVVRRVINATQSGGI